MEKEEKKFDAKKFAIALIMILVIVLIACYILITKIIDESKQEEAKPNTSKTKTDSTPAEKQDFVAENEYAVEDNNISKFDLSFLKFENGEEKNKVYSPLSIKYCFKMLEEATTGQSGAQIDSVIEAYNLTEYTSNEKMALANAFFIKDSYKENIKESYINALKTKYDADVQFDDFSSAEKINSWVKDHTLNLLPELLSDDDVNGVQFALVNALGIDMEWKHRFLNWDYQDDENLTNSVEYHHARIENEEWGFSWYLDDTLTMMKFDNDQDVSSMQVYASINNYDVIETIGEENIRQIVYDDFKNWALGTGAYQDSYYTGQSDDFGAFNGDYSDENIDKVFNEWFNEGSFNTDEGYIDSISKNYGRIDYSTDFEIYVDENVKAFAKDLEEVDGTTLQYIGIMPEKEDLSKYVEDVTHEDIQEIIGNLKELKSENFKDGYLTYIHGTIPKFKFDYDLNLMEDLQKMGITDVFTPGKANLINMTDDEDVFIGKVAHKANIEFTQDGIKASAATMGGGLGAGDWYDYYFEMPTEEIDITFDKPYMFLIRDKQTGETWFVGTVYEPLDINEETGYYTR